MGVMRNFDDAKPIRIEEAAEFNYADFDLSESDHDAEELKNKKELPPSVSRTRRRREERAEKKLRRFMNAMDNETSLKKNIGARKQRRVENARLLLSFVDKDDICTDFSDLVPYSMSMFAQLFEEKENMRIWNEFIQLEEADQHRILANADRRNKKEINLAPGEGWAVVGGRGSTLTPAKDKKKSAKRADDQEDHRKHHPAYSAKACFDRLDARLKQLLRQKSLPWSFLHKTEDQLRTVYLENPAAVWVGVFESGLHRMLVHAISQFLMLTSKSVTDSDTQKRITEVNNPRNYFVPPHEFLIPYLESVRKKKIEYTLEDSDEEEATTNNADDS